MIQKFPLSILLFILISTGFSHILAQDELLVKRENIFAFTEEPTITKKEESFQIDFVVKAFCDVAIAIEDENGNILRHLAYGVLGKKTASNFQAGSLKQSVLWDGKDDRGEYIKDFKSAYVRVSLGMSPIFEKNLYWEPKRRQGREAPIMQSTMEGVYVYDGGNGLDFVKLYSHKGDYIRTIYPFPGNQIQNIKGLNQHTFPDGKTLPIKPTFLQQTFLTSGNDYGYKREKYYFPEESSAFGSGNRGREGNASSILAVGGGKIALGMKYLFRFATDGSSGGMDVEGPQVALLALENNTKGSPMAAIAPRSGALSPDGKTLYLTGYHYCRYGKASADLRTSGDWHTFHCVLKMDLNGTDKPVLFAGNLELDKFGNDEKSFFIPAHVCTDKMGRVYVSDYMNDRVQIFSADGKLLKSLAVISPSQVSIHEKTQEVYVFSSQIYTEGRGFGQTRKTPFQTKLTIFEEFSKGNKKQEIDLPAEYNNYTKSFSYYGNLGFPLSATVASTENETYIWLVREWTTANVNTTANGNDIEPTNIKIFTIDKNKLVEKRNFEKEVTDKNIMAHPVSHARPRIFTNPKTQKLFIAEGRHCFEGKSFKEIREIDPVTGAVKKIDLPFDAEDMCFDQNGFAYLRTLDLVGRFDITSVPWREVPWDYGIEHNKVHTGTSDRREGKLISGIPIPAGGFWHQGGIYVNAKGKLVVGCLSPRSGEDELNRSSHTVSFKPVMFPGRSISGRGGIVAVHVYDQTGKVLYADFVPGLANNTYGIGLDSNDNLYVMSSGTRMYDGKRYYNRESGSVMKFKPNTGKILSSNEDVPVTLAKAEYPKDNFAITDAAFGKAWVVGAEWFFGGAGFSGKNSGVGCACWNARMAFDYFNRSFVPEIDRFSVAVLDEAGNLVLRIGQFGNPDSQGAKSSVPLGGDEVGITHGAYLATTTDRNLYIADPANQNIVSVKLNYAVNHKQKLP